MSDPTQHRATSNFIGGAWRPTASGRSIDVVDASTGEVMGAAASGSADDVAEAVAAATAAKTTWRALPAAERAAYLNGIADALEKSAGELAEVIAREVGSTIGLSRALQVTVPVHSFRTAAAMATTYEYTERIDNSIVVREPLGVVGAITAWNFPLHLMTVKSAYALAAGNTVVIKPSEVAPLSAFYLAEAATQAGLPAGVLNIVFGTGVEVGEPLVTHPDVAMISFTGSTRAGRRIGELAASQIKRVALELGGKSPSVVLSDGDAFRTAVEATVDSCIANTGQRCDALTRLVVPRAKLAEAERIVLDKVQGLTVGGSMDPTADLGPVVSATQLERVRELIQAGIDEGSTLLTGGPQPVDPGEGLSGGYFVAPTVFTDVEPSSTIAQAEIFGPVLAIQAFDSVDEAVDIANDTEYGLHAAIWADSDEAAIEVASRIDVGWVTINNGAFNPLAPYGGYKQSGLGREYGRYGFEEFTEIKSMQTGDGVRPWAEV